MNAIHPVPHKPPRRWVRLLTLGVSLCVGLGIAELGFRLGWVKRLTIGAGIEHPHFHHRLQPQTTYHYASDEFDVSIDTNRFGLRGADPVIPKPEGVVRILMLGDSYTFGFPVRDKETFCARIESALRAEGHPVEVINGGVSGYSPTLHYISLRDEFLLFEPDLVLLWYDLGDLQEDAWFQRNLLYDEQGRIARCDPRYRDGRFDRWGWVLRHSALAKYLHTKLFRTIHKIRVLGLREYVLTKLRGERAKVAIARLKREQSAEDLAGADRFLLVRETVTADFLEPYWDLSARYLRMIHELLRERQIPLMLGVYPYGMMVGPDHWAEGRTFWGFERGRTYDATAALTVFQRFSEAHAIPLLNTFEDFKAAGSSQQLFYDWDGHFTPAGHDVVAMHVVRDPAFRRLLTQRLERLGQSAALTTGVRQDEPAPGQFSRRE